MIPYRLLLLLPFDEVGLVAEGAEVTAAAYYPPHFTIARRNVATLDIERLNVQTADIARRNVATLEIDRG